MAVFDQRGQKVKYQFNAAGDINFDSIDNKAKATQELEKLIEEIKAAVQAKAIPEEAAIDAESQVRKAVVEAKKPDAKKSTILNYLKIATTIIDTFTSATGLVTGITKAIEMIGRVFHG